MNVDALDKYNFKIETLEEEIKAIRTQIDSDKSWKDEFKRGLDKNNEQINRIGDVVMEIANKLSQEIDERKREGMEIKSKIRGSGVWLGILLTVGGGIFTLFVTYLAGILQF
ncbi:MAG: hypothetical protein NC337_05555 [Roseburia sp.]|nr:hypothetical protein [Roseburia sp.]